MKKSYLAIALPLILATVKPAFSQEANLPQLLAGKSVPLSITAKDLNTSYRRVVINDQSQLSNIQSLWITAKTGVDLNLFFTKGETVNMSGETYLIAYKPQNMVDPLALINDGHGGEDTPTGPKKLRPNTSLALSLLNLRSIGSLTDIRPFDTKLDVEGPQEINAATVRTLERLGRDVRTWVVTRGQGSFPYLGSTVTPQLIRSMYPQVHDRREWQHPTTNQFFRPNPLLSRKRIAEIGNRKYVYMFTEAVPASDGLRAVLFVDGHVERVTADRWTRLQNVKITKPVIRGYDEEDEEYYEDDEE
jgi:prepilin-type processing-associated H-X9-DG protein